MAAPNPKLRYSSNYIRSLINSKIQDIPATVLTANDLVGYHIDGLVFAKKPGITDQFGIWKVFSRTPPSGTIDDPFDPNFQVDMIYVEVELPVLGSEEVQWWVVPSTSDASCLQMIPTTGSHSIAELDIGAAFDFAYFDAMSLSMQCQTSNGIYLSGAFVIMEHLHFKSTPTGQTRTLKSEVIIEPVNGCINDVVPYETPGRLSDTGGLGMPEQPPQVVLGVPCPPFWGILFSVSAVDAQVIRNSGGGGDGNRIAMAITAANSGNDRISKKAIANNNTDLELAYKAIKGIAEEFKLDTGEYSDLFQETIGAYFKVRTILETRNPEKYLAKKYDNNIKTAYNGMDKLRQVLNSEEDKTGLIIVSSKELRE